MKICKGCVEFDGKTCCAETTDCIDNHTCPECGCEMDEDFNCHYCEVDAIYNMKYGRV